MAQQFRSVLRRAFGQPRITPMIGFIADRAGLTVKCMSADAAVELRVPGQHPAETLWLPFSALDDFEGKKDDPVELSASSNNRVSAQWRDSVPQITEYNSAPPPDADKFPALPTDLTANPPELLDALHEASEVADVNSPRFATGCLQLTPSGAIHATDGRQGLIQNGFAFPWSESLLIPRSKVFHSPEFPQDNPVSVARSGDWLAFSVGPWTIYLRVEKDARYPDMGRIVPDPAKATTRCQLSEDDAKFLVETLPKLPSHDEQNKPVTLDVNGHVAIRAKSAEQAQPTEVVLTNSACSGKAVRININRTYLKRAVRLGLRELCLYGDNAALLGQADSRKLVWMPLEPGAAIKPTNDAIRIESPKGEASASTPSSPSPKPKIERKPKPVRESNTTTANNGHASTESTNTKSRRRKSGQDISKLIDQAIKFRTASHNLMHEAGELVKALKQHRRTSKAIQSALTSISQVKSLI